MEQLQLHLELSEKKKKGTKSSTPGAWEKQHNNSLDQIYVMEQMLEILVKLQSYDKCSLDKIIEIIKLKD